MRIHQASRMAPLFRLLLIEDTQRRTSPAQAPSASVQQPVMETQLSSKFPSDTVSPEIGSMVGNRAEWKGAC